MSLLLLLPGYWEPVVIPPRITGGVWKRKQSTKTTDDETMRKREDELALLWLLLSKH